jgi:hypothetical protein
MFLDNILGLTTLGKRWIFMNMIASQPPTKPKGKRTIYVSGPCQNRATVLFTQPSYGRHIWEIEVNNKTICYKNVF